MYDSWAGQGSTAPWTNVNENFEAIGQSFLGAHRKPASSGLVVGLSGGTFDSAVVADTTVTGTDNATNYIVMHRTTRAFSTATTTTNWNDTTTYGRVARAVFASAVLTFNDERNSVGGIFDHGSASSAVTSVNAATGAVVLGSYNIQHSDPGGYFGSPSTVGDALQELAQDIIAGGGNQVQSIQLACSDETTALTAGTAKLTFRMPYEFTLSAVRASVTTAPTGGTLLTVDINEAGTTILSTKLTFDASEKTTTTAATPAVISDTALADDAEITIDIDAIGSTIAGSGLKVTLIGTKT